MKLKDIKLKTCPFCDGEGVLIHSKPDDGYIYSEGVHAFVKCKECDVRFNNLKDEEFCCYGRRGKKKRLGYGYIAPYDKESV